jgi:hypothetical protein
MSLEPRPPGAVSFEAVEIAETTEELPQLPGV